MKTIINYIWLMLFSSSVFLLGCQQEQPPEQKKAETPVKQVVQVKQEDPKYAPRLWFGALLKKTEDGVVVDKVLPGGNLESSGIKAGDIIKKIGTQDILELASTSKALAEASRIEASSFLISRGGSDISIMATPQTLIYANSPFYSSVVDKSKCDANCNCVDGPDDWSCTSWYNPKGDGPNGGIMLECRCVDVGGPHGHDGTENNCGTKEWF